MGVISLHDHSKNLDTNVSKLISKQSQLSNKQNSNKMYKNKLFIYGFINIILFLCLFYLMIKNK